jgi:hypothetical protein
MTMKMKTGLLASVLMLVTGVALAQGHPHGGSRGPWMGIDKLEILLDLDGYQKQELQKILQSQRETMKAKRAALRESATRPSRDEMKAEREAMRKQTRDQLAKILSESQLKKFDVLTERPPKHRGRGARNQNR